MSNRKLTRVIALTVSLPGGRPVTLKAASPRHAAGVLRGFAKRRGVSPLALDWSARVAPAAR